MYCLQCVNWNVYVLCYLREKTPQNGFLDTFHCAKEKICLVWKKYSASQLFKTLHFRSDNQARNMVELPSTHAQLKVRLCTLYLRQALFLTSAVEKTKTQAQNSSQKLKLWEAFPKKVNNSRKKLNFDLFSRGVVLVLQFLLTNIFNFKSFEHRNPQF